MDEHVSLLRSGAMTYRHIIGPRTYVFDDLRAAMARATPPRSGDALAGLAAAQDSDLLPAEARTPLPAGT